MAGEAHAAHRTPATVLDVNATPVLDDVCEDTWCIDTKELMRAITPRTRAIIPVHIYDSFAEMDEILRIACQQVQGSANSGNRN